MKKFIKNIAVITCLLYSPSVFTQEFYFKLGGGYALPSSGKRIYSYLQEELFPNPNVDSYLADIVFDQNAVLESSQTKISSFGKGGKVGLTVGYMFTEHVGFEVAFNGFFGSAVKTKIVQTNLLDFDFSSAALMYTLTPALVVAAPLNNENIQLYGRAGAYIGLNPRLKTEVVGDLAGNEDIFRTTDRLSKKTLFGAELAVGSYFRLNSKISIYGEFAFISASNRFKKRNIIKREFNGVNILPGLDVTEFDLVKKLPDINSAGPALDESHPMPFGSVGLNVGVKYSVR